MAPEQDTDLILYPDGRLLLDHQKVDLQRFCVQIVFFFKDQSFAVPGKLQIHRCHKAWMPLYLCLLRILSFVCLNYITKKTFPTI